MADWQFECMKFNFVQGSVDSGYLLFKSSTKLLYLFQPLSLLPISRIHSIKKFHCGRQQPRVEELPVEMPLFGVNLELELLRVSPSRLSPPRRAYLIPMISALDWR